VACHFRILAVTFLLAASAFAADTTTSCPYPGVADRHVGPFDSTIAATVIRTPSTALKLASLEDMGGMNVYEDPALRGLSQQLLDWMAYQKDRRKAVLEEVWSRQTGGPTFASRNRRHWEEDWDRVEKTLLESQKSGKLSYRQYFDLFLEAAQLWNGQSRHEDRLVEVENLFDHGGQLVPLPVIAPDPMSSRHLIELALRGTAAVQLSFDKLIQDGNTLSPPFDYAAHDVFHAGKQRDIVSLTYSMRKPGATNDRKEFAAEMELRERFSKALFQRLDKEPGELVTRVEGFLMQILHEGVELNVSQLASENFWKDPKERDSLESELSFQGSWDEAAFDWLKIHFPAALQEARTGN